MTKSLIAVRKNITRTLKMRNRKEQIDRCIREIMQIPGSWGVSILEVAYALKNALQTRGIAISSECAYSKVIQYINRH
jgi:hypothetical protein